MSILVHKNKKFVFLIDGDDDDLWWDDDTVLIED